MLRVRNGRLLNYYFPYFSETQKSRLHMAVGCGWSSHVSCQEPLSHLMDEETETTEIAFRIESDSYVRHSIARGWQRTDLFAQCLFSCNLSLLFHLPNAGIVFQISARTF